MSSNKNKVKMSVVILAMASSCVITCGSTGLAIAGTTVPSVSSVGSPNGPTSSQLFAQAKGELFSDKHAAENAAVRAWQAGEGIKPIIGQGGSIIYPYGQGIVRMACSPMYVCDIKLLKGDKVQNLSIGDSAQWLVNPAWSGTGANAQANVVVKPTAYHIQTNMIITTNTGHVYNILLKSVHTGYDPLISFFDPQTLVQNWSAIPSPVQPKVVNPQASRTIATLPNFSVQAMNFDYRIEGHTAFRPIEVFSVEGKVYIELPASVQYHNMPVLLVESANGNKELVNAGHAGNWLIVDDLFNKAELVSGIGGNQERIRIIKKSED
jgi:type IV secretion system protein VirB9